jgi:glycosyltransferase involved in cell wall biosynthesis
MGTDVKISVIIPAYNVEETIINCVESVLQQTLPVFEIIIINDGSSDNTLKSILSYKTDMELSKLYIYTQPNSGPSKARNEGIKYASGNWIAFLDADDMWLPDKIEKQVQFLYNHPDFFLIGTLCCANHSINTTTSNFRIIAFRSMIFSNKVMTSTVLIKRCVLNNLLFDEHQKYSEDYKLWLQISIQYKIAVLRQRLVLHPQSKGSLSSCLWKMEKGELSNYSFLFNSNHINLVALFFICACSLIKYLYRVVCSYFQQIRDWGKTLTNALSSIYILFLLLCEG